MKIIAFVFLFLLAVGCQAKTEIRSEVDKHRDNWIGQIEERVEKLEFASAENKFTPPPKPLSAVKLANYVTTDGPTEFKAEKQSFQPAKAGRSEPESKVEVVLGAIACLFFFGILMAVVALLNRQQTATSKRLSLGR